MFKLFTITENEHDWPPMFIKKVAVPTDVAVPLIVKTKLPAPVASRP